MRHDEAIAVIEAAQQDEADTQDELAAELEQLTKERERLDARMSDILHRKRASVDRETVLGASRAALLVVARQAS